MESGGFKVFSGVKRQHQVLKDDEEPKTSQFNIQIVDKKKQAKLFSHPLANQDASFKDLGLGQFLIDALNNLSIRNPTPVQQGCIPPLIAGLNVIACAPTGSGKSLAFALPIIQNLSKDPYGIFALILTPTRELAYQIAEQFRAVGECIKLRTSVIVGGVDMQEQAIELAKRPHVVIATPGRLADHLNSLGSGGINLKKIKFLVMDEADRLLEDDTFADDLEMIMDSLNAAKDRQTLLFSATISKSIEMAKTDETFIYSAVQQRHNTVDRITQKYLLIPSITRDAYLVYILQNMVTEGKSAIVFVSKCKTCEILRIMLHELGLKVCALHSKTAQKQRIASLGKFRSGVSQILIATDVGSRGLDIPAVNFVINYDVPCCATDYVHRIGRTARAGRSGTSITIASERDVTLLDNIEQKIGKKMSLMTDQECPEKVVNDLLKDVSIKRKEAMMLLSNIGFGEKDVINVTKHLSEQDLSKLLKTKKVKLN
ncbi:hypothetical protein MP228_000669 [Amoeboaphelidium protococcarum]|nr:hypothetical protein MP228_000669 [Amoeboaphelidium protococcarum]